MKTLRHGYKKRPGNADKEIVAVCSEIHTKHTNTLCGQNVEFLNVKTRWYLKYPPDLESRSQWQRGLRRRSSAARLLRLWVRIPPGAWMFVCCECCVLSGRGLCDGLITRPEESHPTLVRYV